MTELRRKSAFSFPVRVYYEDTDAAGVVYYANYLKFMERARTEWLSALGFPLAAFEQDFGAAFVVRRFEIDFLAPARLNDTLDVTVEAVERGASRLVAAQSCRRDGVAVANAKVTLACLDKIAWRPIRIPKPLREALESTG
jgi:acyl-CoA thioester hydrolase